MRKIKALFVSYARIGDEDATGQTMNNIFHNIEGVDILHLCLDPTVKNDREYPTICLKWNESLLNFIIYKNHAKKVATIERTEIKASTTNKALSFKEKCKRFIKEVFPNFMELFNARISAATIKEIKQFNPDVIYTLGASAWVCGICCKLSDKLSIPVVMHSMDDHIHIRYQGTSRIDRILKKRFRLYTEKIYASSGIGLAIGPQMAKEYERKFGIPFGWAMNPIDSTHFTPISPKQSILLIFSGGVHGGRAETIKKLSKYIYDYNKRKAIDTKVFLEVFTNNSGVSQLQGVSDDYVKIDRYVPREQLFQNLSRATFLVHVESFDEEFRKYFRLSMSTKIPEYLSVGRPILYIGPQEMGTGQYLKQNGVGYIVESVSGCGEIFDTINKESILQMSSKALSLAKSEHSVEKTQEVIRNALIKGIENYQRR